MRDASDSISEPKPANSGRDGALKRTFSAFRHRNYQLFWGGQIISLVGTWMQTVAQSWLVLQLTDSAFLLGVIGALQFLPVLLFGLFGGVVADRLPKRNMLVITQSSAMVLAFILGVLVSLGHVQVWQVMALAAGLGLVNAFDMPIRQAFVVEMVGKEDLMNAISLNSSLFNAARIIGPAIGGLCIGWFGLVACFYLNGLSFLAVIVGLVLMHVEAPMAMVGVVQQSVWENLSEGLQYVRRTPIILLLTAQIGILSIFGMSFNVVIPVIAQDVLRVNASGYGLLTSAMGFGSFVGAMVLASRGKTPRLGQVVVGALVFSLLEIVISRSHWFLPTALGMVGLGCAMIVFAASTNTLLQTVAPDHLRGRVMSVYTLVFAGASPLGSLFAGTTAAYFGPMAPLWIGGAICLVAVLAMWRLFGVQQQPVIQQEAALD